MLNQEVVILTERTLGPVSKVIPDHIRSQQLQSRQEMEQAGNVLRAIVGSMVSLMESEKLAKTTALPTQRKMMSRPL